MKKSELHDYFVALGKKGGKKRMKQLTKDERSELARKAVNARWAERKDKKH